MNFLDPVLTMGPDNQISLGKCLLETRTSKQEAGGLQQQKGEIGNLNSAPQLSRTGEEPSWENWVGGL